MTGVRKVLERASGHWLSRRPASAAAAAAGRWSTCSERRAAHITALEIDQRLPEVGRATVYRALEQLEGLGLIQRVDLGGDAAGYERVEPSGHHHHHIVCEHCGRVVAFEDEGLERAIVELAKRPDFNVSSHEVTLRGECATARANPLKKRRYLLAHVCCVRNGRDGRRQRSAVLAAGPASELVDRAADEGGNGGDLRRSDPRVDGRAQGLELRRHTTLPHRQRPSTSRTARDSPPTWSLSRSSRRCARKAWSEAASTTSTGIT